MAINIGIKFGLFVVLVYLCLGFLGIATYDEKLSTNPVHYIITIVTVLVVPVSIILGHLEFNKKNDRYIDLGNALIIGFCIVSLAFTVNLLFSILSFEYFYKEKFDDIFGQNSDAMSQSYGLISIISSSILTTLFHVIMLLIILTYEGLWKIFKKAGKKGWEAIVPIYNVVVLVEIVKKPSIWALLYFIPIVNIFISIIVKNELSKQFGKEIGYTIGLIFLPFIFLPLLGMSHEKYFDLE